MKKTLTLASIMIALTAAGAATGFTPFDTYPEDGETLSFSETPAEYEIDFAVDLDEGETAYLHYDESGDGFEHPNDTWVNKRTGETVDPDDTVIHTYTEEGNKTETIELDTSTKWIGVTIEEDTGERYEIVFGESRFSVTQEIEGIDDRDDIIDGGALDRLITFIANMLGIGLTFTRMLIGFIISLGVGLAIGYSDTFSSTEFAAVGFGFTFVSLMFIGLIPMIHGTLFMILFTVLAWKTFQNRRTTVKA